MPIYEYQARDQGRSCSKCMNSFDVIQSLSEKKLEICPVCGAPVVRLISAPAVGSSQSNLDDRAKSAGFHKLKKLGKGEYEKQY